MKRIYPNLLGKYTEIFAVRENLKLKPRNNEHDKMPSMNADRQLTCLSLSCLPAYEAKITFNKATLPSFEGG